MSAVPAVRPSPVSAPQRTSRESPQRPARNRSPSLVVVTPEQRRPSGAGFVLSCVGVLLAMMLGLLLLNVAISGSAFTLAELDGRRSLLADSSQALQQRVAAESAPASLADKAARLGMVPAPQTIVLAPDAVTGG